MGGDLTIRQRKLGYFRTFQFGGEKLVVTLRDPTGEFQFSVPYEAIDVNSPSTLSIRNRFIWQAAIGVAIVLYILTFIDQRRFSGIATIAMIFLCLTYYLAHMSGLLLVRFVSFPMVPRPAGAKSNLITIISTKNADAIIAEIKRRWRDRLRFLYGVANLAGNPQQEEARLRWLKDRDVISDAEFSEQMRRLHALQNIDPSELKPAVN